MAINLRLLNPGKIGGMEVYVKNLLAYMLKYDQDLKYLLFVTQQNSNSFQYDKKQVKKYLVNNKNYKTTLDYRE